VLPEGIAFRDWVPGQDDRRIYDVVHTAFAEFGHRSQGFGNWAVTTLRHEAASPELVPLAVDGERIIGVALGVDYGPSDPEGWVEHLAVERAYRGRGIGGALLRESFRRFRRAGKPRAGLSTNSDTGALGLYEHVGMHVERSYTRYAKRLT
jgi:ribosomal protein S18 acetylase RimI-like enzyme